MIVKSFSFYGKHISSGILVQFHISNQRKSVNKFIHKIFIDKLDAIHSLISEYTCIFSYCKTFVTIDD